MPNRAQRGEAGGFAAGEDQSAHQERSHRRARRTGAQQSGAPARSPSAAPLAKN